MDWNTTQAWFGLVFNERRFGDYIELRALPTEHPGQLPSKPFRTWVKNWSDLEDDIKRLEEQRYNVYVGLATRRRQGGKKEDLAQCDILWIDLDWEDQEDKDRKLDYLSEATDFEPSFLVWSGGGVHCYWLMDEPLDLTQPDQLEVLEHTLKGLADGFDGDRSATDAGRIFRVAGTTNWPDEKKRAKGRKPAMTWLDQSNASKTYKWLDFSGFQIRGKSLSQKAKVKDPTRDMQALPEPIRAEVEKGGKVARLFRNEDGEKDESKADWMLACQLARNTRLSYWTIVTALRVSREFRRCAGYKDETYYPRTIRKAFAEINREVPPDPHTERAGWIRYVLRTQHDALVGLEHVEIDITNIGDSPRWYCCVPQLQFYGVSVISGGEGLGKSTLAISAAVEAASDGWEVIFLNAELSVQRWNTMLSRYVESGGQDIETLQGHLRHVVVQPGVSREEIVAEICKAVPEAVPRVLVVLDSINSIAALSGNSGDWDSYIPVINWLSMWAMAVRRETGGDVSFLIVSELNVRAELVGRRLKYLADLVLQMQPTELANQVNFQVTKGRETGILDLGTLTLDWRWGRFEISEMFEGDDES